ncbi:MAG: metallophosphoesterase [Tyzzerella sp.]|nr:metallophosphoesterase [Tyzzerella sp.]
MRILIISDTHGSHRNLDKVLDRIGKIDMLLHMGDVEGGEYYIEQTAGCPVHIVSGNNDFFADLPDEQELRIGKYRIFMTHGHYYYVSMDTRRLKKEARKRKAQIVMYGHTHRPDIDLEDDVIAINPGSLSYPRQPGRQGTYIIMDINEDGVAEFTLNYV